MASGIIQIGSYEAHAEAGSDLLAAIHEDIKTKTGLNLSKPFTLRHITITGNDGDVFIINSYPYELRNSTFATPYNAALPDALKIVNLSPNQSGFVQIYYIR
jgi:hypothetical protein